MMEKGRQVGEGRRKVKRTESGEGREGEREGGARERERVREGEGERERERERALWIIRLGRTWKNEGEGGEGG